MADGINTVQDRYTRVVAKVPFASGASAETAAATAGRQILSRIYPGQKAQIGETYAASLKAIPDGPAKTEGIRLGMEVAAAVHAHLVDPLRHARNKLNPSHHQLNLCHRVGTKEARQDLREAAENFVRGNIFAGLQEPAEGRAARQSASAAGRRRERRPPKGVKNALCTSQ
jgi:hypothetical protein